MTMGEDVIISKNRCRHCGIIGWMIGSMALYNLCMECWDGDTGGTTGKGWQVRKNPPHAKDSRRDYRAPGWKETWLADYLDE